MGGVRVGGGGSNPTLEGLESRVNSPPLPQRIDGIIGVFMQNGLLFFAQVSFLQWIMLARNDDMRVIKVILNYLSVSLPDFSFLFKFISIFIYYFLFLRLKKFKILQDEKNHEFSKIALNLSMGMNRQLLQTLSITILIVPVRAPEDDPWSNANDFPLDSIISRNI